MKKIEKIMIVVLFFLSIVIGGSCKKENMFGTLIIRITDGSYARQKYDQLLLEIAGVDIHYTNERTGSGGWITLSSKITAYNILNPSANAGLTIASANKLPAGRVDEVFLLFGANNKVVLKKGKVIPLNKPDEAGIKINTIVELKENRSLELTLDFNAMASVQEIDDGSYKIEPHIQIKNTP